MTSLLLLVAQPVLRTPLWLRRPLRTAAAAKGLTIKVETHGQVGVENELTAAEIRNAKAVVVAADKDVQAERFAGKPSGKCWCYCSY